MKKSFFLKILSGYILIIFILSGIILVSSFGKIRAFYVQNLARELQSIGAALRPTVIPLVEKRRYGELDTVVKKLDPEIHARITIIDPSGIVLADSEQDPNAMENHASRPEIKEALSFKTGMSLRYSTTLREKMLYVAIPLLSGQTLRGVVRVSLHLKDIDAFIGVLKSSLVRVTLIVALFASLLSFWYARTLITSFRLLIAAARRIAAGNFDTKIALPLNDEFSELSSSFNYMTEHIRTLFSELSQQKDERTIIIDSLQESLLVIDRDEKVVFCNKSFQKIAGNGVMEGRFYWETMREAEFSRLIKMAQTEQKRIVGEVTINAITYLCNASLLPTNKEIIVVMHDINEMKQLIKVKKDLTVNVSHELRTPLSAIKGYIETLEDSVDKKNRHYLDVIKRNTDRLINIVDDLLSLSDLEEKGIIYGPVQLNELITDVTHLFTQKIEVKKLSLSLELERNLPPINGDQFRLEQMIINLIDNAIKYTEKGAIQIATIDTGTTVELSVRDTGIGIPPEHLERIFERFYVVDKSRSRKLGGTGLGLSIVKHIVLLHNGTIRIDSDPGKGTTFTVVLPYWKRPPQTLDNKGENLL